MGEISDVLRSKGAVIHSIGPGATVYDAIEKMSRLGIGALLVVEGEMELRGIVTERDYMNKVALMNRRSRTTTVAEIMSTDLQTAEPRHSVDECLARMTARRHRHLPIVEGGRLVGVVSVGDLVKYRLVEQKVEIQDLTDYVTGKYPR